MADTSVDISKLKVADLKKELKARGQAVGGNKTELIERLQACLQAGDTGSVDVGDDVDDKLLDEDSTLDDETVEDTSAETEDLKTLQDVSSSTSPVKPATEPEETKNVVSLSDLSNADRLKLRAGKFGAVSDAQKKQLRAEKFGMAPAAAKENDDAKKLARAEKFGIEDPEAKKIARAERFGLTTSTTTTASKPSAPMSDKLKKRMKRFGVVTTTGNSSDKLEKRKERFGVTASSDEIEAKKQKRAERFGLA